MTFSAKHKIAGLVFALCLIAAVLASTGQEFKGYNSVQPQETLIQSGDNILFIGNSLTYYGGGLNDRISYFAGLMKIRCSVNESTTAGFTLSQHNENTVLDRFLKNNRGRFTKIVLQGHSGEARSADPNDATLVKFEKSVKAMAAKIRSYDPDCKIYLFAHVGLVSNIGDTATIYRNYKRIGDKIGAIVVPAGPAWLNYRSGGGDIRTLYYDVKHPSEAGTDLNACVFYGVLFGRNPQELPVKKSIRDAAEKTLVEYGFLSKSLKAAPGR